MRKINFAAMLVTIVFCCAFLQIGCQRAADTNRSDSFAPANANRETVDTAAIEAELLRIERDWPRVVKERDVAAVGRVEADDAVFVSADGSVGSKQKDLADISSGAITADVIEMNELTVKVLDNDAAFVTGVIEIKNGRFKMADGKTSDITGKYRFIDTFARRNGDWQLVAGVSTRVTATAASAPPAAAASPAIKASPTGSPVTKPSPAIKASPAIKPSPVMKPSAAVPQATP